MNNGDLSTLEPAKKRRKTTRWDTPVQESQVQQFFTMYSTYTNSFSSNPTQSASASTEATNTVGNGVSEMNNSSSVTSGLNCPQSLKSYIERAFVKCMNTAERDFMDKTLKRLLNFQKSSFHTRDWDNYPLLMLPRESKNI
jgi:hypothetical protein